VSVAFLKSLRAVCSPAIVGLALLAAGCAGYRLGPTNGEVAGAKSIQINPFQNQTIEPRLTEYATSALRKRLQQDGTYRLNTSGEGDIIVTAVITRFDRSELTLQPTDVRTVRDYHLLMSAQITAVDRATGKTLVNRFVNGRTSIRVGADLTSAERQAIPLLADDLARNATSLLVDGTW
jgi:hypothetical protein